MVKDVKFFSGVITTATAKYAWGRGEAFHSLGVQRTGDLDRNLFHYSNPVIVRLLLDAVEILSHVSRDIWQH